MLELFERNPKEGIFGDALLGLCLSENPQANEFVYAIGMMYDGGPVAEELSVEKIPAHTWADFECTGPIPGAFQEMQHTLLKNRIRALYLSKELVETELLRMGVAAVRCEV